MAVEQPRPDSSASAGLDPRWTRLAAFVAPRLDAGEQVRAVLSKSGNPPLLIDVLAGLASLDLLADHIATHRAIVVTDRQVFIVRMPWLRSWSFEHVSDVDAVSVTGLAPGSLPAGGMLFTPGNLRLHFSGNGYMDFWFGVDGSELRLLRAEAEAVVNALAASATSGDISAHSARIRSSPLKSKPRHPKMRL
jgi:hypothetical protein